MMDNIKSCLPIHDDTTVCCHLVLSLWGRRDKKGVVWGMVGNLNPFKFLLVSLMTQSMLTNPMSASQNCLKPHPVSLDPPIRNLLTCISIWAPKVSKVKENSELLSNYSRIGIHFFGHGCPLLHVRNLCLVFLMCTLSRYFSCYPQANYWMTLERVFKM